MPDCYEELHACLDATVDDASLDADGDGLTNLQEYLIGTEPCVLDTDSDGCSDSEELGPDSALGGTRDPIDPYDFYDVPAPTLHDGGTMANRDKAISLINDVLAVLSYSGTSEGGPPNSAGIDYAEDVDGDTAADGRAYDRSLGAVWSAAPDGAITIIGDVLLVLAQSGHSCQAPPP